MFEMNGWRFEVEGREAVTKDSFVRVSKDGFLGRDGELVGAIRFGTALGSLGMVDMHEQALARVPFPAPAWFHADDFVIVGDVRDGLRDWACSIVV